jgi:hypothetical protein
MVFWITIIVFLCLAVYFAFLRPNKVNVNRDKLLSANVSKNESGFIEDSKTSSQKNYTKAKK